MESRLKQLLIKQGVLISENDADEAGQQIYEEQSAFIRNERKLTRQANDKKWREKLAKISDKFNDKFQLVDDGHSPAQAYTEENLFELIEEQTEWLDNLLKEKE